MLKELKKNKMSGSCILYSDALSGILCIYYDSRLELLWRTVYGISVQPE